MNKKKESFLSIAITDFPQILERFVFYCIVSKWSNLVAE